MYVCIYVCTENYPGAGPRQGRRGPGQEEIGSLYEDQNQFKIDSKLVPYMGSKSIPNWSPIWDRFGVALETKNLDFA